MFAQMVASSIIFVRGVEKVGKEEAVEHRVRTILVCVSNNALLDLLPSVLNRIFE